MPLFPEGITKNPDVFVTKKATRFIGYLLEGRGAFAQLFLQDKAQRSAKPTKQILI
jgi:hypothetical protein